MGVFTAPIEIGDPENQNWVSLDALVDTGASITAVPASILHRLNVHPIAKHEFEFAQGEVREMDVGQTWIRVQGREVITLVLFNEEGTQPLLGAMALEGVFLGVDPHGRKLIPVRGLMM